MRVTQSMLSNNMLSRLSNSYERLGKLEEQINTQKKITRPSDDPVVAMKGMSYRTAVLEVEQYQRNFGEAYNWVENTDSALDKATQALHRIRELTVQASNDTYEETQRQGISEEVKQLKEHLAQIANTKFGDKYLFNGTDTMSPPVDIKKNPPTVSQNSQPVLIELAKGVEIPVNANPQKTFSQDLFTDVNDLITKLDSGATGKELNGFLTELDNHIDAMTYERASMGARLNRIELMEDRINQQEVIAKRIMSENEDIDIEKAITQLKTQESIHRASLGVGARIIQPTLMDFLR
ncbi:flagellar hook-associated protein FlgL [Bacillus xiapuensis]|uniref:flagellar hook-associated protein FlgL n=1 Tax=Bacillus xiapuensis TaxID=2014075 RepID=UPI000C23C8EC|nr:flagellar hook-associated protein FlgL [Bacillus xiapuensis]